MKLYTFLDSDENITEQVSAENHDQAVMKCSMASINFHTDFYSVTLSEK